MNKIILILFTSLSLTAQTKIDTSFNGIKTDFYNNGNAKSMVEFVKGKPNGLFVIYYENSKIKEIGTFIKNRIIGHYTLYYENGNIQHSFTFNEKGKRMGLQRYYYENGAINHLAICDENGSVSISFDANGELVEKLCFDAKGNKIPKSDPIYEEKKDTFNLIEEIKNGIK